MWVSLLTLAAVIVMVAVVIAVPTMLRSPQTRPLAPGLAALEGTELAALLPTRSEFPTGWTVEEKPSPSEVFGSTANMVATSSRTAACSQLFIPVPPPFAAAGIAASPAESSDIFEVGVGLSIYREFDTRALDRHAELVAGCTSTGEDTTRETVAVLKRDLQHLRYTVSRVDVVDWINDVEQPVTRIHYFSYARSGGLLVAGYAGERDRALLDTVMASTLGRIAAR